MNNNIIAVTFSFLSIKEISKYSKFLKSKPNFFNLLIKILMKIYDTDSFNINGKINNFNLNCGICSQNLGPNYIIRFGLIDCFDCSQKNGFNIEVCYKCCQFNLFRGQYKYVPCCKGHCTIYCGVNILSF